VIFQRGCLLFFLYVRIFLLFEFVFGTVKEDVEKTSSMICMVKRCEKNLCKFMNENLERKQLEFGVQTETRGVDKKNSL
jgi:hypothetical protein